jgi:hypothetical protein
MTRWRAPAHIERAERTITEREREIATRDDTTSVLRTHIERAERIVSECEREIAMRDAALSGLRIRIDEAEAALTEREVRLQAAEKSAAEDLERAAELSTLLQQPRHRLAESGNNALKRWMPVLHHLLGLFASAQCPRIPWPIRTVALIEFSHLAPVDGRCGATFSITRFTAALRRPAPSTYGGG